MSRPMMPGEFVPYSAGTGALTGAPKVACYRCSNTATKAPLGRMSVCDECFERGWGDAPKKTPASCPYCETGWNSQHKIGCPELCA